MATARFMRPDGRAGSYRQWAAERSAQWKALTDTEREQHRAAASGKFTGQVKAQADGPAQLYIYDEIGWFGVAPADVVQALSGISGDVEVHVNSPGGDVWDGLAIYAAFQQHQGDVTMIIDGLAASAASFIAQAAAPGKLQVTANGVVMIHDAWGMCIGNAADMVETAQMLEESSENIASIYALRSGMTVSQCRDLMKAETWATGQKAVDLLLADSVLQTGAQASTTTAVSAALPWQVTVTDGPETPDLADIASWPVEDQTGEEDAPTTDSGDKPPVPDWGALAAFLATGLKGANK